MKSRGRDAVQAQLISYSFYCSPSSYSTVYPVTDTTKDSENLAFLLSGLFVVCVHSYNDVLRCMHIRMLLACNGATSHHPLVPVSDDGIQRRDTEGPTGLRAGELPI